MTKITNWSTNTTGMFGSGTVRDHTLALILLGRSAIPFRCIALSLVLCGRRLTTGTTMVWTTRGTTYVTGRAQRTTRTHSSVWVGHPNTRVLAGKPRLVNG